MQYSDDESSEHNSSCCCSECYSLSIDYPLDIPDDAANVPIFAGQRFKDKILPLVDFSFALDKVLHAESFPEPVKLLEECEAMIAIVERSRARKGTEPVSAQGLTVWTPVQSNLNTFTLPFLGVRMRRPFRPAKVMRNVHSQIATTMRTLQTRLRLPRLVFWL
ncbi:hypothetical protein PYCCODRAFT_1126507 [Trametes coccinea BRFM310]|uniref:Uncharacterized protein n=1 Tax=Trametes coccinea (strain BRFM310) TaxID=1353009 RepID=A0A1Y2IAX4_TRAC3|nr:hypothetical protein PYCCODRAFT_1126507 [Trametes coccinea BRFM310]